VKPGLINLCLMTVMAAAWSSLTAAPEPRRVSLRVTVMVEHPGPVLLSDLLPRRAEGDVRQASANVELCQAPPAGIVRVLRAEQVVESLRAYPALLRQLTIPTRITIQSPGPRVSDAGVRDAISEFLRARGWQAGLPETAKLQLPKVSAADGESVQVTHLHWDRQRQALEVRLRCSKPRSCAAFLGYVVLPQAATDDSRNALLRTISGYSQRGPDTTPAAAAGPPLVAKGKTATLVLVDETMQISMPVICLEPGLLNQEIRVFDRRGRRVFVARVIGDHLLRANL